MTGPNLSIIPAGAVTDTALEPRDLQVLCLLGRHADTANGWCTRSQVKMADELQCGRATIQRSLERLHRAGYVDKALRGRGGVVANPEKQPFAAHAYRVRYYSGDELDEEEGGAHGRAPGVPRHRTGTRVPTHGRAPLERPLKNDKPKASVDNARHGAAAARQRLGNGRPGVEPVPGNAASSTCRTHPEWLTSGRVDELQAKLSPDAFWLVMSCRPELADEGAVLHAPSRFVRDRLLDRHQLILERTFGASVGVELEAA